MSIDMNVVKSDILEIVTIYQTGKGEFAYATFNDDEQTSKLTDVIGYIETCGFTKLQAIDVLNDIPRKYVAY